MKQSYVLKQKQKLRYITFLILFCITIPMNVLGGPASEQGADRKSSLSQEKIKYSGVVKDEQGITIIGATAIIQGTSTGTTTDVDGVFSIDADAKNLVLVISYLGYNSVTIELTAANPYAEIVLTPQDLLMDEVVIIGYGTQTKKTLTGAVSSVKIADIETGSISTLSHALGGKMAGLRVTQTSAQPGGGASFTIRGATSVGASNQPLFVIDGFPISTTDHLESGTFYKAGSTDGVLESLNPDDIESVTILKDAASTSIYGARAGNGVVLITTKRGKAGKPKITYSGTASAQISHDQYDMLSTSDYMAQMNLQEREEYLKVNGIGIYADYIKPSGATIEGFKPRYSDQDIATTKGTDWIDEVTRNGYIQQHNVSMTGGTESTRYLTSFGFMKQEGIVKNNGAQRFSARINLDQDISDYVKVGITASYSQNKYDNVALGDAVNEHSGVLSAAVLAVPAFSIYNEDGTYFINPEKSFVPNAVSLLDIVDKTTKDRIMATAFVIAKPIEGWEVKAQLGADRRFQKRSNYIPKTTLEGEKQNGYAHIRQLENSDYLLDLTSNYGKTINDHTFKVLLGYSFQTFSSSSMLNGNTDFITDAFGYNNIGAGANPKPTVGSGASKSSLGSYFARVNYNYKSKYLFEATVRADGASNFEPDNRWGYFPAVSGAWLISEESFMESSRDWLSNLKLRASYGQTGNSSVGYRIQDFYSAGRNYIFNDNMSPGVYISELGNKDITWETTTELNIGIDLSFFNNRLRLAAEYYDRTIDDLLVKEKPLPSYNEVTKIAGNIGSTQGQGFELTVNYDVLQQKELSWNTTLTLSSYKDRWLERDPNWKPEPYQKENDPIRAWWDYEALGIMRAGDKAPDAQPTLLPGMVILKDQNGDDKINQEDKVYMDSGDPKLIFGFNNQFAYKNFDLSIYFYGESGRKRGASYLESWVTVDHTNVSSYVSNSFSSDNLDANDPTILRNINNQLGDYYVKSIYYIRCGNINIGYKIPIKKSIFDNLRVQLGVNNPFIITNWTGLDPETDNGSYAYPNVTSYNLGINVTF